MKTKIEERESEINHQVLLSRQTFACCCFQCRGRQRNVPRNARSTCNKVVFCSSTPFCSRCRRHRSCSRGHRCRKATNQYTSYLGRDPALQREQRKKDDAPCHVSYEREQSEGGGGLVPNRHQLTRDQGPVS